MPKPHCVDRPVGRNLDRPAAHDAGAGGGRRRTGGSGPPRLGSTACGTPSAVGDPRAQLAAALPDLANDALAAGLLERLSAAGKIVAGPRAVALKGHVPKLSQAERKLKDEIADAIKAGGMSPPDAAELAASAGQRGPVVADLLASFATKQRLVEINSTLFFDADCELELKRRVLERMEGGAAITMAELRDLLGTSRKYAVPIGEYLDKIGLTKRDGDLRRLGSAGGAADTRESRAAPRKHPRPTRDRAVHTLPLTARHQVPYTCRCIALWRVAKAAFARLWAASGRGPGWA